MSAQGLGGHVVITVACPSDVDVKTATLLPCCPFNGERWLLFSSVCVMGCDAPDICVISKITVKQ